MLDLLVLYRLHKYALNLCNSELFNFLSLQVRVNCITIGAANVYILEKLIDNYRETRAKWGFMPELLRVTRQRSKSCLYHIFSRLEDQKCFSTDVFNLALEISDHNMGGLFLGYNAYRIGNNASRKCLTRIDYTKLRMRLLLENWMKTYNEANFLLCFDRFCYTFMGHIGTCSYSFRKKLKVTQLKRWISSLLLWQIKQKNKIRLGVNRSPDNIELLNPNLALERAIRVEMDIHRKNYYARLFNDCGNYL